MAARIARVQVTPVSVPLEAPIRWAWGVRRGVSRNLITLETDDGLAGIGETMGGEIVRQLAEGVAREVIGQTPFGVERFLARVELGPYFSGYNGLAAVAGVEMALWDLMGKTVGRPVCDLLGGCARDSIEFSAYLFYRYPSDHTEGEFDPEHLVAYTRRLMQTHGFRVLKLKGGVFSPEQDVRAIALLREAFGPGVRLRLDPNGSWSPQTALRIGRQLLGYDLEYLEDPTWGLEGMATVRRGLPIPLATNMCVVTFEDIPPAVRLGAVDVILGDAHKWGGLWATKKLAAVCETFGLGLSIHSGAELGVSTAANLHLAASTPAMAYAVDSHYHHQMGDVLAGGPLRYVDGAMRVPDGPGLGVDLDPAAVEDAAGRYRAEGAEHSTYDPYRPDWVPRRTQW